MRKLKDSFLNAYPYIYNEGVTAYTVDYAKQNGLDIINVVEEIEG